MNLFLYALAEYEELIAMTQDEYGRGCESGSIEYQLVYELCEIEEPTKQWVRRWLRENRPDLLSYSGPNLPTKPRLPSQRLRDA